MIGIENVPLFAATYGSIQSKVPFNDAIRVFAVAIGYAPTDGGWSAPPLLCVQSTRSCQAPRPGHGLV